MLPTADQIFVVDSDKGSVNGQPASITDTTITWQMEPKTSKAGTKPDGSVETQPQATYYGLPVIGYAAESYSNGTLVVNGQPVLSNYGGLIGHRYTNVVQ